MNLDYINEKQRECELDDSWWYWEAWKDVSLNRWEPNGYFDEDENLHPHSLAYKMGWADAKGEMNV